MWQVPGIKVRVIAFFSGSEIADEGGHAQPWPGTAYPGHCTHTWTNWGIANNHGNLTAV